MEAVSRAFAARFGALSLFAALGIAALAVTGCSSKAETAAQGPQAPPVSVSKVVEREVNDWDEFTGRIEPVESVALRPRVSGYIERVAFVEGGLVKKGDLLFVIDPRPYRLEYARARAEVAAATTRAELAANEVTRAERLLASRAISQEEHDQRVNASREASAAVEASSAAADSARLNLEFTRVVSPISGRVSKAEVTVGNLVDAGQNATLLTTVVSIDPVYVEFEGDEQVYLKYAQMQQRGERQSSRDARNPVFMGLSNDDGYPNQGYMTFVDNRLNPETGTIRGRAIFENKDGRFTPGLFARIKLIGSGTYHAVLVNDRAIGTDQSQKYVLVVGEKNVLAYRPIKTGRVVQGLRVVLEGLKPGETIVVNGIQRVRPGIPVTPQPVAMDQDVPASARLPEVGVAPVAQANEKRSNAG